MYNGIRLYGKQTNSYVRAALGSVSEPQTSRDIILPYAELNTKPNWTLDTIMQADYNQETPTLSSLSYDVQELGVVGYKVYRLEDGRLYYVADTGINCKSICDYNTKSRKSISYYIFPKVQTDTGIVLSDPIISNSLTPSFDGWSVIGLSRVNPSEYFVDTSNLWVLSLNVESGSIKDNTNKTLHETYTRFPKHSIGKRRYKEGDIQAYLGYIGTDCEYCDSQELMDKWEDFAHNSSVKLLKSPKGMVLPIIIKETSFDVDDTAQGNPCKVNFSYVQVADATNLTAYCVQEGEQV